MINARLTTAQAAARLGVKPATVYAYVSRGLLHPERGPRGSSFDLHEVAALARTARRPVDSGRPAGRQGPAGEMAAVNDPVFVTELTTIRAGRLYYRGLDAVELSRRNGFEEVAAWLWTGAWPEAGLPWSSPPAVLDALGLALARLPTSALPAERFMVAVVAAAMSDDLRHDLQPAGVPVTGRALLATLAAALPRTPDRTGTMAERVWAGLTSRPCGPGEAAAMDAALVLAADHELAPSTLAARVAAAFRADPYAVVLTGLGPASGSWRPGSTGAPTEVESLLGRAAELGAERAIGEQLRRTGEIPHGFGMPLYPEGDPRGAELLRRVREVGPADRYDVVAGVTRVAEDRGFPAPNFDLGLGALAFCAEMTPGAGQAVFTLGKVAGWLAHAIEEYVSPTRFRSRADYIGPDPVG
jgi:citrate synthase